MPQTFELAAYAPVGSHTVNSSLSAAVNLSTTMPTGAKGIMIQALTQNVCYTLDGTTPTASNGFIITAGQPAIVIRMGTAVVLKVIEAAASASIQYCWVR
jgi:hypothetical protein